MVDSRLYSTDTFVVLEPQKAEEFVSEAELQAKLQALLTQEQDHLPPDLARLEGVKAQAQYLIETACEFKPAAGGFVQWYAVRLEK